MAPGELRREQPEPGVALLTLARPEQLNAVTMELQQELEQTLTELEADPEVRCIVLTGAGEKAFSSGYDVHEMADWSEDEMVESLRRREPWVWHVATTRLPLIAAVNGLTYGIGAIMATGADVRIGTPATVFRFTAGAHGGANATWTLPALVGYGMASELLMTSREIGAEEAERIGLLNRVVEAENLMAEAVKTASQIASNPPAGPQAIKRLLREHRGRATQDRFAAENEAMRTELRPRPVSELYEDFLANGERPDPSG